MLIIPTLFVSKNSIYYAVLPFAGFDDNGAYWRSWYEDDKFESEVAKLWEEVKPLYQQLHAYVKNKLLQTYSNHRDKFPSTCQIPAHILGE